MKRAAKIALWGGSALTLVGILAALAAPAVLPVLPRQAQVVLGGTIHTVPGTVEELFAKTESGAAKVTHADVDDEYVIAATVWPWELPPAWGFPTTRGVADSPGNHWDGMGVTAAFSIWATATLEAVKTHHLAPPLADHLLDEVEDAYRTLYEADLLSDRSFIEESVTPLRS